MISVKYGIIALGYEAAQMLRRVLSWSAAFATRSILSLTAAPRHCLLHSKGITGVIKVAAPGVQCLPAASASPMMCDTHACSGLWPPGCPSGRVPLCLAVFLLLSLLVDRCQEGLQVCVIVDPEDDLHAREG